jgi:hypothetical protein
LIVSTFSLALDGRHVDVHAVDVRCALREPCEEKRGRESEDENENSQAQCGFAVMKVPPDLFKSVWKNPYVLNRAVPTLRGRRDEAR